jgi:hypothetical protein
VKASDYEKFCRDDRQVFVQLRGPAVMTLAVSGHAVVVEEPDQEFLFHVAEGYREGNEGADPPEELREHWLQNAPMKPLMKPVVIGVLQVDGELLVVEYRIPHPKADGTVKMTICPDDIAHISWAESSLIQTP